MIKFVSHHLSLPQYKSQEQLENYSSKAFTIQWVNIHIIRQLIKYSALEQNKKNINQDKKQNQNWNWIRTKSIVRINKDIKFIKTIFHMGK